MSKAGGGYEIRNVRFGDVRLLRRGCRTWFGTLAAWWAALKGAVR